MSTGGGESMNVSASTDWYLAAVERCTDLAWQMVRLDQLAADYEAEEKYTRADSTRWEREAVAHERSQLLRELWQHRRVVVSSPRVLAGA